MPKEVVTPQVIANWFANKRKEMRRKSNEENRPRNMLNGVGRSQNSLISSFRSKTCRTLLLLRLHPVRVPPQMKKVQLQR